MLRLNVVLLAALGFNSPIFAGSGQAQSLTLCYGERDDQCESRYGQASYEERAGCGSDPELIGRTLCRVRGSDEKPKFTVKQHRTESGGQCGYALFDIVCEN